MNAVMRQALATLWHEIGRYQSSELMLADGAEEARTALETLRDTLERAEAAATAKWNSEVRKVAVWKEATR